MKSPDEIPRRPVSSFFFLLRVLARVACERNGPSACHQLRIDVFGGKSALSDYSIVAINIAALTDNRPPTDVILQRHRLLSASPQ